MDPEALMRPKADEIAVLSKQFYLKAQQDVKNNSGKQLFYY